MKKIESGAVHFLALILIAVLLIGLVGYFSVARLKGGAESSVLGETESNLTNDLDAESDELESVGDIDDSLPDVDLKTGLEAETTEVEDSNDNIISRLLDDLFNSDFVKFLRIKFNF